MSPIPYVPVGELMRDERASIDPRRYPNETFELYSIPAFDNGVADAVLGDGIGSAKQVVEPRDVLLSRIVPHIRRAWVVGPRNGHRQIASGEWIVFRGDRADPGYLRHVLVSDDFHSRFMMTVAGVGGSLLRARPKHVAQIQVPIPPLPEQRRIAAILDQAEALRAKRRAALAQLDEMAQAIFVEMFGLSTVKVSIGLALSRGVFRLHKDGNHGNLYPRADDFGTEGVPFLSAKDIDTAGRLETATKFLSKMKASELRHGWLKDGDVLLAHNATVGKVARVTDQFEGAIVGTSLTVFRPNGSELLPDYLEAAMRCRDFQEQLKKNMSQTTRNQVPITAQRNLEIFLPAIDDQRKFTERSRLVAATRALQARQLLELDSLFASLQHRAFRGQL